MAPRYDIPEVHLLTAPLALPTKVQSGSTIILPWPAHVHTLAIDGQPFSRIGAGHALAVVPRKEQKYSTVAGEFEPNVDTGAFGFRSPALAQPTDSRIERLPTPAFNSFLAPLLAPRYQYIFHHALLVDELPKRRKTQLRLPAEVIKTIASRDADLREAEARTLREVLSADSGPLNDKCWQRPLYSKIVSEFGSPRQLPNGKSYRHSGLDLRAAMGTPVQAAASGVVAFAGYMTVPGNVVIVDHGDGVFTQYMHLSAALVEKGKPLQKGDIVGLSGATGRVEAPHLHWEVVWRGNRADPLRFLAALAPICDPT